MKFKVGDYVEGKSNIGDFIRGKVIETSGNGVLVQSETSQFLKLWCYYGDGVHKVNQHKIVITTDGTETLARMYGGGKVIKSATAKCASDDTFDFEKGAKIAFDWLMHRRLTVGDRVVILTDEWHCKGRTGVIVQDDKEDTDMPYYVRDDYGMEWWLKESDVKPATDEKPFVPHLFGSCDRMLGEIGEPTNYKDAIGRQLFIGDTVEIFNKKCECKGEYPMCKDVDETFVMSIRMSCDSVKGTTDRWKIIKKRSHDEIKNGDTVGCVKYVKEP